MNRRDFLKGAILLPSLASLLPVLGNVSSPGPALAQYFRFTDSGWIVVLESWLQLLCVGPDAWGRCSGETEIGYSGHGGALEHLARLIQSRNGGSLRRISMEPCPEEIVDEWGNGVAIVTPCWSRMQVKLDGIWQCQPGVVPMGETGIIESLR